MRNLEPDRPPGLQVEDSCEEMGKKIQYIGRYVMDGQTLGKGNFARVELATHGVTKIKVAIKVIDTRKIKEDYVRQNLHREARIMAQLRHPNIIRLYETLKATTLYCLVLEYACGGELLAYIKEQKESRLVESAARPYFRQLLSALQYLHDRGVVHRDLKMENILLDEKKKNIKLVDFGLSNVYSKDQALKTHCGSPEYAAPELFQSGRTYGPEIDVWSLGIITYAMIVGKLPFIMAMTDQYHRQKLLQQIQKGLSTQHDREMQYLTKDCRELIHQLIEPNPELRLSLTEVITKPWVTKNAKLPFTIYQSPPRDKQLRTQVVHELAELMKMERKHVSESVKENRADELSAMFNMLVDQKKRERGFFDLDHTSRRPETRMPVKGRPLGSKGKTDQPGLVKRSIPNKLNVPIERYPASSQGALHAQENSIQASSVQADSTSELTSVSANKRCAADKAPTRGPTTRIPKRHQTPTHKLNLTLDLSVVNIPAVSSGEARHCTSRQTGSKPPHCRVTSPTKIPQASPNQDSQSTSPDDSSVSSRKKRTCLPLPRPSSHKPARPTSLNFRGGCSAPKGSNPGAKASQQDSRPLVAPKATPEDITFTSSSSDTNLETMQCDMLNASDDEKLEKLERLKHTMLGGCVAKQSDKVCDTDSTAPASQSRAKDIHPSNQLPGSDITEGYVARGGGTPTQDSLTQKPVAQPSIKASYSRKDSRVAAECEGATSIPYEIHSGQENNTKSRGHKISFTTAKAESNSASDHQYSVTDSGKLIDRVLGAELNSPDHLHIGGSGDRVLASVDDDDENDDEVCENCEGGAKSPVVSNTPEGMSSKEPSSVHASPELKHCTNCGTQFPSRPKVLFATGAHALDMFVSPEEFSPTTQEWNTQHSCSSRQNPMQAAPLLRGSPSLGSPQLPYMLPPHRMPLVPPVATMHTFNRDAVQHGGSSSKPNGVKVTKNSAERWTGPQNVSNPQTTHTTVQARAATAPSGLRFRFTPANKPHSITENSVYTHVPDKSMRLEPVGAESHSPMGEPFTGNHISAKTSTNNGKIENSKPAEAVASQQLVRAQSCDKSSPSLSSESQHSTPTNSARWTSRSATPPKSPQKSGTPKWLLMKQYDQQRKQMSWRQGLSHLLRRAKPNGAPSSPSNNVKAKSRSLPANSQLKRREAYYKEMDAKWTAPPSPGPTSNSMQVTSSPVHSSPPTPQHQFFDISHSRTTPPPADKTQEPTASSYGEASRNGPRSSLKYHRRRSNSCKEGVPGETPAEEWQNLDAKVKLEYSIDTAIHKSITVSNAFSSRLPLRHRAKVGQQPTHHNSSKRNT